MHEKKVLASERFFGVALMFMSAAVAVFVVGLITVGAWDSMPWFIWPFALGGATFAVIAGAWIGLWAFRGMP